MNGAYAKLAAKKAVLKFAMAILHGDEEHQAWLLAAAKAFNEGMPIPEQKTETLSQERLDHMDREHKKNKRRLGLSER